MYYGIGMTDLDLIYLDNTSSIYKKESKKTLL